MHYIIRDSFVVHARGNVALMFRLNIVLVFDLTVLESCKLIFFFYKTEIGEEHKGYGCF